MIELKKKEPGRAPETTYVRGSLFLIRDSYWHDTPMHLASSCGDCQQQRRICRAETDEMTGPRVRSSALVHGLITRHFDYVYVHSISHL
jgi:hypothetical protein